MYGTWCKAQFIPEKLMVKMGNNGCQQKPSPTLPPIACRTLLEKYSQLHNNSESGMEIPMKKANHSTPKPPDNVGVKAIYLQDGDSSKTTLIGTGLTDK